MRSLPSMLRMLLHLSIVLLVSSSIACATRTQVSSQWKSPDYTGGPMRKILVVAVADSPLGRRAYEDRFAQALRANGTDAIASYQLFPGDQRLTKQELEAVVRRDDFDGVIVSRLLGVEEKTTYVPPTTEVVPTYGGRGGGYYGYYGRGYDVVHMPGYTQTTEIVKLETKLWNARDSQLAWGIVSSTFDPTSTDDGIASVTKKLVSTLSKDGLLAK